MSRRLRQRRGRASLCSETVELGRREMGPGGRQIPDLLAPYLGFPVPCVHKHRAEGEKGKYRQACALAPWGGTGDGGWRGGGGRWETGAEPSLILSARCHLCSLSSPSNKQPGSFHRFPYLPCAHWPTIPIRPGQLSPLCLHAQFGLWHANDIYFLSVVWPEVSLFSLSSFIFSWLYKELRCTSGGQSILQGWPQPRTALHTACHTQFWSRL